MSTKAQNNPTLPPEAAARLRQWLTRMDDSGTVRKAKALLRAGRKKEAAQQMSLAVDLPSLSDIIDTIEGWIPIKAVSLGIMAEGDLIIGGQAGCGVAMDIKDFGSSWSIYGYGGLDEGVDAGVEIGIVLGFWAIESNDISGTYVGAEVDITDVIGVEGIAYAGKDDKSDFLDDDGVNLKYAKVIYVGVDVGLEDGVEGEEVEYISWHHEYYATYQVGDDYDYLMSFDHLTCVNSKDNQDDVYFLYTVDGEDTEYRYPIWNEMKMCEEKNEGDVGSEHAKHVWLCDNMVKFNTKVVVKPYVGNYTDMPTIEFTPSSFAGLNIETGAKTSKDYTDMHVNEINYTLTGRLLRSPDGAI